MELDDIRKHWEQAGERLSMTDVVTPTSRDPHLGRLEQSNILNLLKGDQDVLEIGCGDAQHTVRYARQVKSILGLDVAASLIRLAERRAATEGLKNVHFNCRSVLHMTPLGEETFDCVISQRCLINLPTWQHQREALEQIFRT